MKAPVSSWCVSEPYMLSSVVHISTLTGIGENIPWNMLQLMAYAVSYIVFFLTYINTASRAMIG